MEGFWLSVRASATRCCWPPESWSQRIYALSRMPTLSSAARAASFCSLVNMPKSTRKKPISGTMEVRTFLSAVARVTRLKDWKIMPILRRNLRSALPESLETSVPSTVNSPSVISIMRLMVRISVDLPAPDRPIMATNSPCSNLRLTSLRPLTPLGYVLETCLNSIKRGHFLFAKMRIQTIFS